MMKFYLALLVLLVSNSCSINWERSTSSVDLGCVKLFHKLSDYRPPTPRTYFVMPRINGSGSLDDISQQLDSYKAMGVDQLWIGPIHPQVKPDPIHGFNDHGYWTLNHALVDPELGGEKAFQRLMKKAQEKKIEIMLDTPINHFGYGNKFKIGEKNVLATDERYFRFFDNESEENMWKLYGILDNSSSSREIIKAQVEISKLPLSGLPSLKHANPEVAKYLINSYKGFIDRGVTKFRIDAVKHIPFDFLGQFMNELTKHGKSQGKDIEFLLELLVHGAKQMDVLAAELIRLSDSSVKMQFLDFPHAAYLRGIAYPGYRFSTLAEFIKIRQTSNVPASHFVPFLENHDLEKPLPNAYTRKMAYAISEFISQNKTILYHGHEGVSAGEEFGRQAIKKIDPNGEIATILRKVGTYANEGEVIAHQVADDTVVLSRKSGDKEYFFVANKTGNFELPFAIPHNKKYQPSYVDGNIIPKGNNEFTVRPRTFVIFEPID